ncbi:alkaline phosphatase D family protein [Marinobacter changyiensis]|uniref:alkaline phosphatase D family protein n=1 Tax=Marinobacter changyiensis TaxID=2604091 RepID=UPI001264E73C|nr:alkaline phosphatase D family protein [Marinobacter changyiensis]
MADESSTSAENPDLRTLPLVIAGPILRHVTPERLVIWLVTSERLPLHLTLTAADSNEVLENQPLNADQLTTLSLGTHAFLQLIDFVPTGPLPTDTRLSYDIGIASGTSSIKLWIRDWASHLCLPGASRPDFVIKSRIDRLLHGSCRRPHHPADDGLVRVDEELIATGADILERPALLMMKGDQIYADDVAGPMLRSIHELIGRLELFHEHLDGSVVANSRALFAHPDTYYHRDKLLPATKSNEALTERFFGGVRKPVFTTSSAQNHLISFAEIFAMYLLVWSPVCWRLINPRQPRLDDNKAARYRREMTCIEHFVTGLPRAARAMAHLPCYMIFDDHDITDDWNLSALWEATAYGHPFSKRIVGNALMGYLLCQGWGNNPSAFESLMSQAEILLNRDKPEGLLDSGTQDHLIEELLSFHHWHYTLPTNPRVVVLDTRTRRWRSEVTPSYPSGLMDWEALTEFQQTIMGEKAVIVVSSAPMFGVKLIETIQRIFTWAGRPLLVDAENWMAHRGAANVLLNIFGHSGTPNNFVILSGDVHYSFAYDVQLRHKKTGPDIWQITSSGLKNEFPKTLLEWLDRINRWLYAPWSPLNWFTKRRKMRVTPRMPTGREAGERLWNNSGIGSVALNTEGAPTEIRQLNATDGETLFEQGKYTQHR